MNNNETCEFTPYFGRQHREFIKFMIKYAKHFKQLDHFNQTNSFYPNQIPNDKTNSGPERGKLKSQPHLSIHPKAKPIKSVLNHRSREEDSIGVLTIP